MKKQKKSFRKASRYEVKESYKWWKQFCAGKKNLYYPDTLQIFSSAAKLRYFIFCGEYKQENSFNVFSIVYDIILVMINDLSNLTD